MLVPKKTPLLKRLVLGSVITLAFGVIAYLVYTNFINGKIEIVKPLTVNVDSRPLPAITPGLSVDFLSREPYTNLRAHGSLPVTVSQLGQANPFIPSPLFLESNR